MKRNVKKIALNRETLRSLDAQELTNVEGAATIPCYPQTYGPSCRGTCPGQPFTTECA
jgi:hypothetical protein